MCFFFCYCIEKDYICKNFQAKTLKTCAFYPMRVRMFVGYFIVTQYVKLIIITMKKFLLSIFCCLMAVFAVQAQKAATLSFADKAQRTSFSTTQQVWEQNGVTFTNNKGSGSNVADYAKPVRFYAKSEIIVECALGNITKIEFDCNSSSYATALKNSIGSTATASSDKVTVTLDGTSNSFTISSLSAQVRMDALTVTYTASGEAQAPLKPTLPAEADFIGEKEIEITCATPDAIIYYTTNGDTPTEESEEYSEPIIITATTTVKAIAVNEAGESELASATYTRMAAKPVITAADGTFNIGESLEVTITSVEDGVTIYYTLDGNDPTDASDVYSAPFSITETTTVKAIAVKEGCKNSEVADATYTAIDPSAAEFTFVASDGGYNNGAAVELLELGDVTVTFDKGSNSNNAPKYYTTGKAIRAYGGNTITFTGSAGVTIKKIELTFSSGEGDNAITADCGIYSTDTWTGASNSVELTIGGTSGHRRIATIKVTYSVVGDIESFTLTVGATGYATLYLGYNAIIPEDVTCYAVTDIQGGYALMEEVAGGVLPKETGVIVNAAANDYVFEATESTAEVTSLLRGSVANEYINEEAYVLGNVNGKVGLYKALMTDGSWLNNANKAYLPASSVPNKTVEFYGFDWGGTTGIENIEGVAGNNFGEGAIYDLTGRKINSIAVTGVYIIDGKKVFIRK